jgi:hypothetical protein
MSGENLTLKEEEGVALKEALLRGSIPKYIQIGEALIATHQISGIFPDEEVQTLRLNEAPRTEEEKANRQKAIDKIREKFNW